MLVYATVGDRSGCSSPTPSSLCEKGAKGSCLENRCLSDLYHYLLFVLLPVPLGHRGKLGLLLQLIAKIIEINEVGYAVNETYRERNWILIVCRPPDHSLSAVSP